MNKKVLRNDIILIASLLVVVVASLLIVLLTRTKDHLVATVKVKNEVVEVIDLTDKSERTYEINGVNGLLHVHVKDGKIAVVDSSCPHQDCVHMGYVAESNRPIICVYNEVYIVINGNSENDVEIR